MSDSTASQLDVFAPGHLGELTSIIDPQMVDAALDAGGGVQQRLRRLPSRVIVYLLLAGALFVGQGWQHVWARLTVGLTGVVSRPAASSLTAAMRRVGTAPLRELFTLLTCATGPNQAVCFAGRVVVAVDGTQIAVPDTEANKIEFPTPRPGPNGPVGYPMIRVVMILQAGTRRVVDAAFGPDRTGEVAYATGLAGALGPGMLLLADRNFATYDFFRTITTAGADLMIRAKTGHGAMALPVLTRLRDGSYLSTAQGLPVRVIDAAVTITTENTTRTGHYRLITTLLDPGEAPARSLVELYHQRWEIETAYCELKSTMLGGRVLRGRYPGAVAQEIWALLSVYQALRIAMADAALTRGDLPVDRLSFTTALLAARDQVIRAETTITATVIGFIGRIGTAVLATPMPARRIRTRVRVIKRAISKYRAKKRDVDRTTYPATVTTTILTPEPNP